MTLLCLIPLAFPPKKQAPSSVCCTAFQRYPRKDAPQASPSLHHSLLSPTWPLTCLHYRWPLWACPRGWHSSWRTRVHKSKDTEGDKCWIINLWVRTWGMSKGTSYLIIHWTFAISNVFEKLASVILRWPVGPVTLTQGNAKKVIYVLCFLAPKCHCVPPDSSQKAFSSLEMKWLEMGSYLPKALCIRDWIKWD